MKHSFPLCLVALLFATAGCTRQQNTTELRKEEVSLQAAQLQQQEAAAAAARAKAEEERKAAQFAAFKHAIEVAVQQQADAIDRNNTIQARVDALRQIDLSECPPDYRTALVDYIYDLKQINQIDIMRTQLASDNSISEILLTQIGQYLTQSKNSAVTDAMQADQQLSAARERWIQQGNEADRNLARIAAYYGVQY